MAGRGTEPGGGGAGGRQGAGFDYARAWRLAAFALAAAAAVLLLMRHDNLAFFAAALAASAWFLNVRAGIKRKHDLVRDGARNWRPRSEVEAREREPAEEEEG